MCFSNKIAIQLRGEIPLQHFITPHHPTHEYIQTGQNITLFFLEKWLKCVRVSAELVVD